MDKGTAVERRIPFFLVTGFLGSGKTTLLKDLLNRYADRYRMAIVQNEFAPAHIDGQLLKETGKEFNLLEVNNGSVFCACLLSDFIERLDRFLDEVKPDIIFLEATGLADPVSLGEILQSPQVSNRIYLAGSWCVADARNFYPMVDQVSRIRHQVRIADLIWLNKTDLVCDTYKSGKRLRQLNPFARILQTRFGNTQQLDLHLYLSEMVREPGIQYQTDEPGEGRPDTGACVVRSNHFFDPVEIKRFLDEKSKFLYRMKGYIRISDQETFAVQTVFSEVKIEQAIEYEGATELVAIGPGLEARSFSREFLSLKRPTQP